MVAGLCLLLCAACATAEPPSILEQTGTQLRADIEQAYRALQWQHQLDMDIVLARVQNMPIRSGTTDMPKSSRSILGFFTACRWPSCWSRRAR